MRRNRREMPEINAGSMSDIAFLLLIFWLVATTLKYESGWSDKLVNDKDEVKIAKVSNAREVLRVEITEKGEYVIQGTKQSFEYVEKRATRLKDLYGSKGRIIITTHYDAPYESLTKVYDLIKRIKINFIENPIDYETEKKKTEPKA